ncbi:MAG TPA: MFS transporter [Planctomycetota bacterium]|nr:MFS transporter [Planctomycetota bacterium]
MDGARRGMPLLRTRLFVMMLLEFFIWGAWLPLIFGYLPALGFSSLQQSLILNAFPVAAIVGMFFSNQFADRNFAGERFLAFSHLVGGLAMLGLGFTRSFWPFFALMTVHCLFYVPTISITNSIAFASLKDAQKEFGLVRMGGTIGWILAAWPIYFIFQGLNPEQVVDATRWTYVVAGAASLALAIFSLSLPHTPPRKAGEAGAGKLAWLEAMKLLRHPFVLVLWIITFVDSFVHTCYFSWTGRFLASPVVGLEGKWIMPVMSISQVSEILTMAVLGLVLKKLGWRATMTLGILGHAARFAVYAFAPSPALVVGVQVLHGICYAFFFATVYIFVDAFFPKDARSSAQGLFNVMILGIGQLVANFLCPVLFDEVFTKNGVTDWRSMFIMPTLIALGAAVALAVFFRPPRTQEAGASVPEAQPSGA